MSVSGKKSVKRKWKKRRRGSRIAPLALPKVFGEMHIYHDVFFKSFVPMKWEVRGEISSVA